MGAAGRGGHDARGGRGARRWRRHRTNHTTWPPTSAPAVAKFYGRSRVARVRLSILTNEWSLPASSLLASLPPCLPPCLPLSVPRHLQLELDSGTVPLAFQDTVDFDVERRHLLDIGRVTSPIDSVFSLTGLGYTVRFRHLLPRGARGPKIRRPTLVCRSLPPPPPSVAPLPRPYPPPIVHDHPYRSSLAS